MDKKKEADAIILIARTLIKTNPIARDLFESRFRRFDLQNKRGQKCKKN